MAVYCNRLVNDVDSEPGSASHRCSAFTVIGVISELFLQLIDFLCFLKGLFLYLQVFGVGVPNPYRLRPYLGAKVFLNSSFSPLISMHNPTGIPLQVSVIVYL